MTLLMVDEKKYKEFLSGDLKKVEAEPNGLDPHSPGAKLDGGKIYADYTIGSFSNALEEVAKVATFGANKYTKNGWETVDEGVVRYQEAQMRHYLKRKQGEEVDPDSGLMHWAHEAWNVLASLELYLREKKNNNG